MPKFSYPCFRLDQREGSSAPTFCLFYAPVGEILSWAAIERIESRKGAVQRAMNQAKVRGVKRFFAQDPRNTIPTAVVVTLRVGEDALREVKCKEGRKQVCAVNVLTFEVKAKVTDTEKPGLVVDGQHRLLGMKEHSDALRIPVVALLNPDGLETAFQFLVINNKSSKVPTDHIRALALEYSEEGLEQRLRTARLSLNPNYEHVGQVNSEDGSPFKDLVDWPANRTGERIVVPAAIEQALQYIQDQNLKDFREDDALLEFFYATWNAVRTKWPDLWTKDSRLLDKVGVICMSQFLTDSLAKLYEWGSLDLTDPDQVRAKAETLLAAQHKEFWTRPWKSSSYDTRVGRQLIVDDLVQLTRNLRAEDPWYQDLQVVDMTVK